MRIRLVCGLAVTVAALGVVDRASAQPRPADPRDSVKKLEAEADKLRAQLKETETKLKAAKEAVERSGERRPMRDADGRGRGGPSAPGFGANERFRGLSPQDVNQLLELFEKMRAERGRNEGRTGGFQGNRGGFGGGFGQSGRGFGGFAMPTGPGTGGFGPMGPKGPMGPTPGRSVGPDSGPAARLERIEKQVDELAKQIQELRRQSRR